MNKFALKNNIYTVTKVSGYNIWPQIDWLYNVNRKAIQCRRSNYANYDTPNSYTTGRSLLKALYFWTFTSFPFNPTGVATGQLKLTNWLWTRRDGQGWGVAESTDVVKGGWAHPDRGVRVWKKPSTIYNLILLLIGVYLTAYERQPLISKTPLNGCDKSWYTDNWW